MIVAKDIVRVLNALPALPDGVRIVVVNVVGPAVSLTLEGKRKFVAMWIGKSELDQNDDERVGLMVSARFEAAMIEMNES